MGFGWFPVRARRGAAVGKLESGQCRLEQEPRKVPKEDAANCETEMSRNGSPVR